MAVTIDLSKEVIQAFTDSSWEELNSISFKSLFLRLKILQKTIMQENMKSNNLLSYQASKKKGTIVVLNKKATGDKVNTDKKMLFEAYEIIQAIRQKLTGEKLTYRLYITAPGETGARGLDVGQTELSNFLSFNAKEIDISMSKVREILNATTETDNDKLFNIKYSLVMEHFRHPEKGAGKDNLYIITANNSPPPEIREQKNRPGVPQVYNRGHIIEALDAVQRKYADQIDKFESLSGNKLLQEFSDSLSYDTVSGFKGGDNSMVQIKANAARLMRYTSIMNAINKVLSIEQHLNNRSEIYKIIQDLYSNSGANNNINIVTEKAIDKMVDDLISILKK